MRRGVHDYSDHIPTGPARLICSSARWRRSCR